MAPRLPRGSVPGGVPTIPTELCREDGIVALALGVRTNLDPDTVIRRTLYGIEVISPGYLGGR
jgi:hypothetical protein